MGFSFHIGAAILALILVFIARYAYHRTTPPVAGRLKAFLVALRIAAFVLLAFLLMDPRYILRSKHTEPAEVIALVDRSASMTLPAEGWDERAAKRRFDSALALSQRMRAMVEEGDGKYSEVFFSDDLSAGGDSIEPAGQGTDIVRSLESLFKKHDGENIAAFVVFSDGVDTENRLTRESAPPVPVFAVGLGDTSAPEDVRIKDVDYNSFVRSPSQTSIEATLRYSGGPSKRVTLRLTEGTTTLFEKDTVLTRQVTEVVQQIPVEFRKPGRRQFVLEADVDGDDVEMENNRRDIIIEAEKAGVKVLIVDLLPSWELHFLTDFLRQDQTIDFDLVTSLGASGSTAGDKIRKPSDLPGNLGQYDAIVLASVEPSVLTDRVCSAIKSFVREQGKGLLVLPGPSSLFEKPAVWRRLEDLLPVNGTPPHRFILQYTSVRPGPQAGTNPITSRLVPLLSQTDWQQRSPLLGYYTPLSAKNGVEVLLETEGHRAPAFIYQPVGKGRVAVLCAGPVWRWKFLGDGSALYDEMISRLLDVLSRGESAERFMLVSDKNVYDTGEAPVFTAEVFNEKMQPVTGAPVRIEITRMDDNGEEVPLRIVPMQRQGSDNPRFKAALSALAPGAYRIRGEAELPGRTIRSQPIDISVSSVSVEFQNVGQDRENLVRIARESGGKYVGAAGLGELEGGLSLSPRIVESTAEMSFRTSAIVFAAILLLLGLEWIVRKRVGMI